MDGSRMYHTLSELFEARATGEDWRADALSSELDEMVIADLEREMTPAEKAEGSPRDLLGPGFVEAFMRPIVGSVTPPEAAVSDSTN